MWLVSWIQNLIWKQRQYVYDFQYWKSRRSKDKAYRDFQDMLRSVAKILKRKAFRTNVYQVTYNLYLHPNSSVYWFIRITAPYARLFIGPIETLQYFEIVILDKATDCTFEIAIILWKLSWDVVCKLENGFKIIRHPRALPKGLNCEWKLWPFFPIFTSSLHIIILYNGACLLVVYD